MQKLLWGSVAVSVLFACSGGAGGFGSPYDGVSPMGGTPAGSTTGASSPTESSADGGGPSADGLPCDVQQILATYCTSCHSDPPVAGPMGLVTYADLTAPAVTQPSKTVAQLSLQRMQSTVAPMPPASMPPVSAADLATFAAWVNGGTPMGACGGSSGGDGGAAGGGGGGGGGGPYGTPPVCTSGTTWSHGGGGSSSMNPGEACISCHASSGEAPMFGVAGTVYPTAHEPDLCYGESGISVVVTDANGNVVTMTTNGSGNFSHGSIATPYTAKVVANGKERAMASPQTSGDCNSCHTENGANGAPGRIIAP
jgi:hypothetical protein